MTLLRNEMHDAAVLLYCLLSTQSKELSYDKVDARTGLAAYLGEVVSGPFTEHEFDAFWKFVWDKEGLWFMQAIESFIDGTLELTLMGEPWSCAHTSRVCMSTALGCQVIFKFRFFRHLHRGPTMCFLATNTMYELMVSSALIERAFHSRVCFVVRYLHSLNLNHPRPCSQLCLNRRTSRGA